MGIVNSKDIEGTNLKTLSRICGKISPENSPIFLVNLKFKILEFYPVMLLHTLKNFEQKLSNLLRCAEDDVGNLF